MKIRFLLVGCGRIGERHAEHIKKYGELVAVCDVDEAKAKDFSSKFQCKYYLTIQEMLVCEKDSDVVSICTPNGLHAEHSILSLSSGLNVLCEKPIALSTIDAGKMISVAEKNNKRVFAIKQNRFNPPVAIVKKMIEDDKIGEIFSIQLNCFWNRNEDYYKNSWKGSLELDGGTLFTQFSHFIDLMYWLIGDVGRVEAFAKNFNHKNIIEFEDTGVVILEFNSGAIGAINYTVNSYKKNMEGSLTIFGKKGTVKIGGQYLNELEYQNIESGEIQNIPEGNKPNNYGTYVGSMSNHNLVYENLVQVLKNNASINTNIFEAYKTVEIIQKIYSSIKKNSSEQ